MPVLLSQGLINTRNKRLEQLVNAAAGPAVQLPHSRRAPLERIDLREVIISTAEPTLVALLPLFMIPLLLQTCNAERALEMRGRAALFATMLCCKLFLPIEASFFSGRTAAGRVCHTSKPMVVKQT